MSKSWFNFLFLLNMHSKYKNRHLIKFIYTFYKYKYTNVFLKYKDKYRHIVYIVYQTSNYKQFFGYLAFTKHNYYIRNATLTTLAGLFFFVFSVSALFFFLSFFRHPQYLTFILK